jgi:uncharacterized protein (DUF4213/DUF364 family)
MLTTPELLEQLLATVREDAPVQQVVVGLHQTAVVSRHVGLASTFQGPPADPDDHHGIVGAGTLVGRGALELARRALATDLLEASLGVAALNSLLPPAPPEARVSRNAVELLAVRGRNRRVALVGHFPFAPRLRQVCRELHIIHEPPEHGVRGVELAAEVLPLCDVVAVTASSLVNHTLTSLLALAPPAAFVLMLGPSTPFSPLLWELGVDGLCGPLVEDPRLALAGIAEGATFREVPGIARVTWLRPEPPR